LIDAAKIQSHLSAFQLSNPELIDETALAEIYRVELSDGTRAVLKCWRNNNSEQFGADYLEALHGNGVVQVLGRREGALLMEHLEGPSLGSLSRNGRDAEATEILARVALSLRQSTKSDLKNAPALQRWFRALFDAEFARDCDPHLRINVECCKDIARSLLTASTNEVVLHGDLHHDNVLAHKGKWIAIDPKGVCGDPAYELANAMRNPKGTDQLMRDPAIIAYRAKVFAESLQIDPKQMLKWAAIKTALSISWRENGCIGSDPESDLLNQILEMTA
jgi:streptomycin 6-kinase